MTSANQTNNAKALYRTIWRWHFYAGIFCIPFVLFLALTGAIYLFKPYYENWQEAPYKQLSASGERLSPNAQIQAAVDAIPGGKFLSYRLPQSDNEAVRISVKGGGVQSERNWLVYINPYTGAVMGKQDSERQLMNVVKTIHGELLLGDAGSILVELAACWAVVLIITGLYLWWPRNAQGLAGVFYPRLRDGSRTFWRDLHAVTGIWLSAFALFLLLTGLPWALVWGGALKQVRALSAPAVTMDWSQGRHQEHLSWRAQASNKFDLSPEVVAHAQALKLPPPVELSIANGFINSWKASSQSQNRPQRVDAIFSRQGNLEKQTGFSEKPLIDRIVGVGIAAHEGQLFGLLNLLLGLLTCMGLMVLSISGFVLWRKRKPDAQLGAPAPMPARLGVAVVAITLGLALFMPVLAVSLMALLLLEFFVLRRIAGLSRWLGLASR